MSLAYAPEEAGGVRLPELAPTAAPAGHGSGPRSRLLGLQRSHGNRFVQRTFAGGGSGGGLVPAVEGVIEAERGGGRPLDSRPRLQMESALGADLSGVRVHTGETASALSSALDARAFTVGSDVFFGRDQYDPDTSGGRQLIAHELTHVLQQSEERQAKLIVGEPHDPFERQADAVALAVVNRERVSEAERTPVAIPPLPGAHMVGRSAGVIRRNGGPPVAVAPVVVAPVVVAPVVPPPPVVVTATVPGHIRAASTPATMAADRIPPRVDTPAAVTVTGATVGAPVTLSIAGRGGTNGDATINGAATVDLAANATVQLRGTAQTGTGSAGNLRLEAHQGGNRLAQSGGFSVSSVPQNYTAAFVRDAHLDDADYRGIVVDDGWTSDSGTLGDLDEVEIRERVENVTATGCYAGVGLDNSDYLPGTDLSEDTHASHVDTIRNGPGVRVANQTCQFHDQRTGAIHIPMTNSGFTLSRQVTVPVVGTFHFTISKVGAAVTALGIASGAAAGNIAKAYDVV